MDPLFRPLSPPTFCGRQEEDPEEWLEAYEKLARDNQWSEEDMRLDFDLYLDGAAAAWYSQLEATKSVPKTWNDMEKDADSTSETTDVGLRTLFLNRFKSPYNRRMQLSKLCHRHQGRNECVFDYCYDVIQLCRTVDQKMTEKRKLEHLFCGLKPSLVEKLWSVEVSSCEEFLREAEKCQDLETGNESQRDEPMTSHDEAPGGSKNEKDQLIRIMHQILAVEKTVSELKREVSALIEKTKK